MRTSFTSGWPSAAISRPQIQSVQQVPPKQQIASTITQRSLQKRHSWETTCEWKRNIAVAHLFSSDTTTLQSPRASRFSRPCLIDPKKKVEHFILGVHLPHDTPDTDDSQHTPPPRGTFMPQSRPQHSHLHDSMQFVKKSRPSAQPRWNSSLP